MNTDKPFCLWTLEEALGPLAVKSNEKPDLSNAPLDFDEHQMLAEARARVAEQEYTNWLSWFRGD